MRVGSFLAAAAAFVSLASAAHAATNLVQNGDFEQTSLTRSSEFSTIYTGTDPVSGWHTNGYNMLYMPGTATTTGAIERYECCLTFWGPGNGSNNGYVDSPTGGNFIAANGAYAQDAITQTINGLVAGKQYTLSFWWAGAQQKGYNGDQTQNWTVSLGDQKFTTDTLQNDSHGFIPWQQETYTFTATGTQEVLSFLAHGEPSGTPPFTLLDGVSLTAAVPEPATWAMMIMGFGVVGGLARQRRRSAALAV